MKRNLKLDMRKVAEELGAERRGGVKATGGYFGAVQLAAEVAARFRTPPTGGRATDPSWTDKRLVPMAPKTLSRLEKLANEVNAGSEVTVTPFQVAAILLEDATERGANDEEVVARVRARTG